MASAIEWTDETWNPVTGCTRVSPGCDHCYMYALYPRLRGMGVPGYETAPGDVRMLPERLYLPLTWRKPKRVFVNSMSDLFHSQVPYSFISEVFEVMQEASAKRGHVFQVLTKRPGRAVGWWEQQGAELFDAWPANVWIGTSVESPKYAPRLTVLGRLPAPVRFVSAEPMQLRREHSTRDINVLNRDANEALPWISKTLRALDRAVVFLYPFATQVSWFTVETLAATQKVDCWVLFPISAVTRQLRREDLPLSEWQAGLDRVFGGGEYWEGLYFQQLPLVDDAPRYERYRHSQQIASKYRDRLRGSFHTVASTQRTLRNSTNSPMFELFFAASNPRGAPIAVDIADHLLRNW